jgi:hypothetical protein
MITSWSNGVNPLPQFRYGTLYLREEPWWLALYGWGIDKLGYGCRLLHWIKLPRFIKFTDEDGERISLRDYYGDLGNIYHIYVFNPLFHWHELHHKSKTWDVEVGYDKVKELFGERDAKFFAEHEE